MIKPDELAAAIGRALFRHPIIRWTDEKAPSWSFFRRVRQRNRRGNVSVNRDQRAATFVRIRFLSVTPDDARHAGVQHRALPLTHRRSRMIRTNISRRRPETRSRALPD